MRFTISAIAISAATFAATLAFAPVLAGIDFKLGQLMSATASPTPAAFKQERACGAPLAKIVDALSDKECV